LACFAHRTHYRSSLAKPHITNVSSQMTSSVNSEATAKSLERALKSNLRLQAELARRVETIAQKKASNRRLASRITSQIVSTWNEIDEIRKPPEPIEPKVRSKKRKKGDEAKESGEGEPKKYSAKKWNYDPYRKWTRRFFVDPDDDIPEPNEDVVKRRKLEEGKFFYHTTSPPWTKKEVQTLQSIVADKTKETNEGADSLDFDNVAQLLEEQMKTDKNRLPTVKPRSGADCRLKYTDTRKQAPFSKEESMKVLEQVHLHNGAPPWPEVATSVNRSTWQCLSTYKTKLTSSRSLPFTPSEDEVLLKIAAAAGPQFVLNIGVAADLAARFFPHRSPKQVLARMNSSLLNPNYAREVWSDEEERRLVLCMKVYRNTPFPLTRAAVSTELHALL
jgi:hypothetical protein